MGVCARYSVQNPIQPIKDMPQNNNKQLFFLCSLLAATLVWAFPVRSEPLMVETARPASIETTPRYSADKIWHLNVRTLHHGFFDLDEYDSFSPLRVNRAENTSWKIKWRDERVGIEISRALFDIKYVSFRPAVGLGLVRGYFAASNPEAGFYESWKTQNALWYAVAADFELRRAPERGPFFNIHCGYSYAEAEEDRESVVSQSPRTLNDFREARFKWKTNELAFSLGWRLGRVTPMVGIGCFSLGLKKWLRYDIPEDTAARPQELEDIRALNSRESKYRYRSQGNWAPLVRLECRLSPQCLLAAGAIIGNNRRLDLAFRYLF